MHKKVSWWAYELHATVEEDQKEKKLMEIFFLEIKNQVFVS